MMIEVESNIGGLLVFGSINQDIVLSVDAFPAPGETIMAVGSSSSIGGKGANQAIAAALSGAPTQLVGAVGLDAGGQEAFRALEEAGVGVDLIQQHPEFPTGTASICVRPDGENTIVVDPAANQALKASSPKSIKLGKQRSTWCLVSLEVPEAEAIAFAAEAKSAGLRIALNASPRLGGEFPPDLIDLLIVNEVEAAAIAGPAWSSVENFADEIGVAAVVVTRGKDGASIDERNRLRAHVPAIRVSVKDTTGCGDAFAGVLMSRLCAGVSLREAVGTATLYAGYSAEFNGASKAYPSAFEKARNSCS